ncbi:UNVERIFIED_ORG: drug/metabolite transporter (DMT)-like permease [Rhizobium esperanzae]|nr:putative permease protein [Rhizobium etli CNPAF512]
MTPQRPSLARELALLLLLATLWGSSYTFIKIGVETIPPLTLIAVRTLIAGAICSPCFAIAASACRASRPYGDASSCRLASTASFPSR